MLTLHNRDAYEKSDYTFRCAIIYKEYFQKIIKIGHKVINKITILSYKWTTDAV